MKGCPAILLSITWLLYLLLQRLQGQVWLVALPCHPFLGALREEHPRFSLTGSAAAKLTCWHILVTSGKYEEAVLCCLQGFGKHAFCLCHRLVSGFMPPSLFYCFCFFFEAGIWDRVLPRLDPFSTAHLSFLSRRVTGSSQCEHWHTGGKRGRRGDGLQDPSVRDWEREVLEECITPSLGTACAAVG